MQADTLSPGTQLAGRYRIEDLVGETPRSQTWRALDRILNRSVSVQIVRGDDASSEAFLTAARAATVVEDPRFLRVLDAAREAGHTYVVREWARGVGLDTVLQQGPLPAQRAVWLVREVSEAIAAAHRAGVQHARIDPARIIVKHNSAIRVLGLATDQALLGSAQLPDQQARSTRSKDRALSEIADDAQDAQDTEATAPDALRPRTAGTTAAASNGSGEQPGSRSLEQADVIALGRLLYACLVARWPGGRDVGLPAAPTEHGRLLRPRQVRAGIDPLVDDVVDRVLGTPPRHHATPLTSAAAVARELAALSVDVDTAPDLGDDDATLGRGLLPLAPDPAGPPPAIHHVPPPRTGPSAPPPADPVEPPHTGARAPVWVGMALLVALAVVLAVLVQRVGSGVLPLVGDEPTDTNPKVSRAPTGPVKIAAASDFDPQGTDGGENPDEVDAALDDDQATAWTTSTYYGSSQLAELKDGVGLLLDLGKTHDVSRVDLTLLGGPTSFKVLAAPPGTTSRPSGVAELTSLGEARTEAAGASEPVQASIAVDDPVRTRWVAVWLTDLPPDGAGDYEGKIAELAVIG